MEYSTGTFFNEEILIAIIAVIIVIFLLFVFLIKVYLPFIKARYYIKMEMARSFDEKEYFYWKRELKMLYLSKIPIVRSIVRRQKNR